MIHRKYRGTSFTCLQAACLLSLGVGVDSGAAELDGRAIAQDVYKGNCLACHQIPADREAVSLANIGPALTDIRRRYPDRSVLRAQIWDPTVRNPLSVMPPFGRNLVLSEQEIDAVVEYIYRY